ncbi:hydrogen gas-evolving membrane-bound hydrogenase subunit E [Cerasicoccus fimbriatus]|uniref:hydrogen gas-evolving membrane-bound hydrogenase subunit E n=1 Tax=Cerasicoccus fimbriatus TaxID=3014554 RepID=UPI0022B419FE|nr:hydrogen gas-evolving membrane-bound hydrogenase subunit E [Cerasicoccus sp. TK19100]
MLLPITIAVLLLAVPWSLLANQLPKPVRGLWLMLPAVIAFGLLVGPLAGELLAGNAPSFRMDWVPALGLDFSLQLNGVGLLLALLVTGIGALIMLYASGYMHGYPLASRLYAYLYAFMLAMVGLALSDHLLLFFVFWELTSITSYLLIGFNHADPLARRNALQALLVTGLGGMALLAGFILMANAAGTWHLSELLTTGDVIREHAHYPAIFSLVILGAFTKSAQFPFHFWLPNAMAAPTPVSAYLHSATMVKAGVFLLALMLPILGGTQMWELTLSIAGGFTLLLGGYFGLQQHDLKKMLAGTTLAVLGLLTCLLGLGTEKAALAALLFLLGHALYKATLFMVAGSIDHETGTRDARILGGLRVLMPWTAGAALLAAISKMGLPPLFGFIGKEYTYKASTYGEWGWLVTTVLIAGNAMLLALALKAGVLPFWRKADLHALPKHPHEAPWSMRIGPIILAGLSIILGLAPFLLNPIMASAMSVMAPDAASAEVKLWTGVNVALLLSVLTVVAGFIVLRYHMKALAITSKLKVPSADKVYDLALRGMVGLANWQTKFLQSGYLRNYLLTIIGSTVGLIGFKLWRFESYSLGDGVDAFSWPAFVVAIIMLIAIALAITAQKRLTALIALGVIGYGVALIFAVYSAPDLAITQILVETLTVALFAWVVYKLPNMKKLSQTRTVLFDAIVSIAAGALVTLLILKSKALQLAPNISEKLAEWSYPEAHGANVVNVILVDFRALDTFGEIIVLAIAAIGVWALLRKNTKTSPKTKAKS